MAQSTFRALGACVRLHRRRPGGESDRPCVGWADDLRGRQLLPPDSVSPGNPGSPLRTWISSTCERTRQNSFTDNAQKMLTASQFHALTALPLMNPPRTDLLGTQVDRFPFVPDDPNQLEQDCYEAYKSSSPAKRLSATDCSGRRRQWGFWRFGLDARVDRCGSCDGPLGRPRRYPGLYALLCTPHARRPSAIALCESLGVS